MQSYFTYTPRSSTPEWQSIPSIVLTEQEDQQIRGVIYFQNADAAQKAGRLFKENLDHGAALQMEEPIYDDLDNKFMAGFSLSGRNLKPQHVLDAMASKKLIPSPLKSDWMYFSPTKLQTGAHKKKPHHSPARHVTPKDTATEKLDARMQWKLEEKPLWDSLCNLGGGSVYAVQFRYQFNRPVDGLITFNSDPHKGKKQVQETLDQLKAKGGADWIFHFAAVTLKSEDPAEKRFAIRFSAFRHEDKAGEKLLRLLEKTGLADKPFWENAELPTPDKAEKLSRG